MASRTPIVAGFHPDGTFVHLPLHDVATLTEAFRRAVLKLFVKRELMDIETAQGMLNWPHSGFHVHDGASFRSSFEQGATHNTQRCAHLLCRGGITTYLASWTSNFSS